LQEPEPQYQNAKNQQNNEGQFLELPGKNLYRDGVEIRCSHEQVFLADIRLKSPCNHN